MAECKVYRLVATVSRAHIANLCRYLFAIVTISLVFVAPGHAASFDCTKAAFPVEAAICGDTKLGMLDVQLTGEFKAAMTREANNRASLLAYQRKWLRERNEECGQNASANSKQVVSCLVDAYTKRIAQLKATPSICEKLAEPVGAIVRDAVRGPVPGWAFDWPRILAKRPETGISIKEPAATFQYSDEEWTKQIRSLSKVSRIDPKLTEQVPDVDDAMMTITLLAPDEDLYALSVPQGRLSCDAYIYFRVVDGEARLAEDVQIEDPGVDGAVCSKGRYFGTVDHFPAIIDDEGASPWSIRDVISIRLRERNSWTPPCSIQLDFTPRFTVAKPHSDYQRSDQDNCKSSNCDALRNAALQLVDKTWKNRTGGESHSAPALSSIQKADYERMTRLYKPADQNVEAVTDLNPLLFPIIAGGKTYLAAVGHTTQGPYVVRSDWTVDIYELKAANLSRIAEFGIDTDPGRLLHVTTGWEEDQEQN